MIYERVHRFSAKHSQTQEEKTCLFARCPMDVSDQPSTQQEIGNETFLQQKSESLRSRPLRIGFSSKILNSGANQPIGQPPATIQAKLTIEEPGDKYEQEADRVAAQVVSQINAPAPQHLSPGKTLQRRETPQEEEVQMQPVVGSIQHIEQPKEEIKEEKEPSNFLDALEANPRIQRYTEEDGAKVSENNLYATNASHRLGCDEKYKPNIPGLNWQKDGTLAQKNAWKPVIDVDGQEQDLRVPADCLTVAELVSAWIAKQDPTQIGIVAIPISQAGIKPAGAQQKAEIGEILYVTEGNKEEEQAGAYHAAPVIAKDGKDVVTMEGDSKSQKGKTITMQPIIDMYAGAAGFKREQKEAKNVYIIKVGEARKTNDNEDDKLAGSIWYQINQGEYAGTAEIVAKQIIQILITNAKQAAEQRKHKDETLSEGEGSTNKKKKQRQS